MSGPRDDEAYWRREKTEIGRRINDVKDRLFEAAAMRRVEGRPNDFERQNVEENIAEDRADKKAWREHFKATGEFITPDEIHRRADELERTEWAEQNRAYNSGPSGEIVKGIRSSGWSMDVSGIVESRVHIGRSENGYHYSVESTDNRTFESDPPWSKAFKTGDLAQQVASAERRRDAGETWHLSDRRKAGIDASQRPPTAAAKVAWALKGAADCRHFGMLDEAKRRIAETRQLIRQEKTQERIAQPEREGFGR